MSCKDILANGIIKNIVGIEELPDIEKARIIADEFKFKLLIFDNLKLKNGIETIDTECVKELIEACRNSMDEILKLGSNEQA